MDGVSIHERLLRPDTVGPLRAIADVVLTWTVNRPARASELVRLGVDGIVTDDVATLSRPAASSLPRDPYALKGIGAFVLVLLVALGIVMYVVTRPPDRCSTLRVRPGWTSSRAGGAVERTVERAIVGLTFDSQERNARGLEPLRNCDLAAASRLAAGAPCARRARRSTRAVRPSTPSP